MEGKVSKAQFFFLIVEKHMYKNEFLKFENESLLKN